MGPLATPEISMRHGELPRLSSQRCLALLAGAKSGHLALSQGALPLVVPVTCALDGARLVVRAGPALLGRVPLQPGIVAFETAGTDCAGTWRWEVLVQGRADVLCEASGAVAPPLALVETGLTTALSIGMELVTGWQYGTPPKPA